MSRKATSSWSRPSILGCTSTEESESENTMWLARLGKRKRTSDFWILLHYFAKTTDMRSYTREIKSCDLQRILILRQAMSWGHVKSLFVLLVGTDQFLAKLFDWAYPNVWWSSMSFIIHCKYQLDITGVENHYHKNLILTNNIDALCSFQIIHHWEQNSVYKIKLLIWQLNSTFLRSWKYFKICLWSNILF